MLLSLTLCAMHQKWGRDLNLNLLQFAAPKIKINQEQLSNPCHCVAAHVFGHGAAWRDREAKIASFGLSMECLCLVWWEPFLRVRPKDIITQCN